MSEYQYYEFLAIDRPLDARQRAELRALSTRARITATSFVNEYPWGDFRGNPAALMERWRLASIALVRSELAAGDLRLLYLAWLLSVQAEEVGDEEAEPPPPPGLRTLSAPLRAVADFLRLDEDLLAAAATASAEVQTVAESAGELGRWIEDLPGAEKDALRLQAARGEGSQVQAVLQRRFRAERFPGSTPADPGTRTAGELRDAAAARREERERAAAERRAQELARQARAAAAAREQRLDALALREEQAWQHVDRPSAPRNRTNTTRQSPSCWTCRHLPNAAATAAQPSTPPTHRSRDRRPPPSSHPARVGPRESPVKALKA